jgi:hypothetical protein
VSGPGLLLALLLVPPPPLSGAVVGIDVGVSTYAPAERGPVIQATPTDPPPPPPSPPSPGNARGRCAQWYDEAIAAGFSDSQWPTVDRVMYGESRCQPGAVSPAGARGLMQIMPMWADDCGGTRADLFSPSFNLACARHVLRVQGWTAWDVY